MTYGCVQTLDITTVDMNTRLRSLGIQRDCDLARFMAAAEPEFSSKLRAEVGSALFDSVLVVTYEDWLEASGGWRA